MRMSAAGESRRANPSFMDPRMNRVTLPCGRPRRWKALCFNTATTASRSGRQIKIPVETHVHSGTIWQWWINVDLDWAQDLPHAESQWHNHLDNCLAKNKIEHFVILQESLELKGQQLFWRFSFKIFDSHKTQQQQQQHGCQRRLWTNCSLRHWTVIKLSWAGQFPDTTLDKKDSYRGLVNIKIKSTSAA